MISMLMGTFSAASKPFPSFLSFHQCFLACRLFCAYLALPAVVPVHSVVVVLSCKGTFHLPVPVYFFLPSLGSTLFLSVELDEWSRWTVSATSSTGCGRPFLAISHQCECVCVFLCFFLSFTLPPVVYMGKSCLKL